MEIDRKGVPVLLKQYLKLGGELVAFHVDRRFADALDGLIVVDLRKTDARVLERYMGKDGAAQFLENVNLRVAHVLKRAASPLLGTHGSGLEIKAFTRV